VGADVFGSRTKPIHERDFRTPAEEFLGLARIAKQQADFTFFRAIPLLDGNESGGPTSHLKAKLCQRSDRNRGALAKVDGFAFNAACRGRKHERTRRVGNEGQIALWREVPQLDLFRSLECLREHRGYHSARRLPWSVGIEGPQRDHRQIKAAIVSLRKLVGGNFACRVGRLPL